MVCSLELMMFLSLWQNPDKGRYQSGQLGQTVNLLAYAFVGSNPALPTMCETCLRSKIGQKSGSSSVDRALAFQAEGRGFESRLPLLIVLIFLVK